MSFLLNEGYKTVVLANGEIPTHEIPLTILRKAEQIICCDGGVNKLLTLGLEPYRIIGDLDSVSPVVKEKYSERLIQINEQETNDLTKSVRWCLKQGIVELALLGATGLREDHALGNISLLAEYSKSLKVKMFTNFGVWSALHKSCKLRSYPGQQISMFSLSGETKITSTNLKYPLQDLELKSWWMGTLNEALSDSFRLDFKEGEVLVYRKY